MIRPLGAASPLVNWIADQGCRVKNAVWTPPAAPVDEISSCKEDSGPKPLFTQGQLYFFNSFFSIGSALCGMMVALHQIRAITLTLTPRLVIQLGNVFFTVANLVNFYDSLWCLVDAEQHIRDEDSEMKKARLLRRSAIMGLVSSGSYLVMGVLSVIGVMAPLAATAGGIAATMAAVQWVHDYWLINPLEKKESEEPSVPAQPVKLPPMGELDDKVRYVHLTTTKV